MTCKREKIQVFSESLSNNKKDNLSRVFYFLYDKNFLYVLFFKRHSHRFPINFMMFDISASLPLDAMHFPFFHDRR